MRNIQHLSTAIFICKYICYRLKFFVFNPVYFQTRYRE